MTMVEVRKDERVRSFLRARILFNNRNTTIDCIVKNFSPNGAKIQLSDSVSLPATFDLDIPQRGQVHRARLMWRDEGSLGVSFVEAEAAAPVAVDPRIERLEEENRRLKKHLANLKQRLEALGQDVTLDPM